MTKIITAEALNKLTTQAASADRRRTHLNAHETLDASVQRLFIATEPGTYIRPHRHPQPHKWEFFLVLEGEIDLLIFDEAGAVRQRMAMSPAAVRAVEVPPGVWHTYVCRQPGTLALEVKEGAYVPTPEADFAPWSPGENTDGVAAYLEWMRDAQPA